MLIPIIETDRREDIQEKVDVLKNLDVPDKPSHLQIDVVDGLFADTVTVMPSDLREINWHGFTFEYHLLVNEPDEYLGEAQGSGAVKVIAQIERMIDRQNFMLAAKELKMDVGFALALETPIEELTDAELATVDSILLMSVPVGFAGQTFNPQVLPKIKELRSRGYTKPIEIDGGVNPSNIPEIIRAGADLLAVNSALWQDDVAQSLRALQNSVKESARVQNP